jgi:hypothetical protein
MNFQYAQPSQTPVPAVVYAILNQGTVIAVAFDLQDAQTICGYNSAYTYAEGAIVD